MLTSDIADSVRLIGSSISFLKVISSTDVVETHVSRVKAGIENIKSQIDPTKFPIGMLVDLGAVYHMFETDWLDFVKTKYLDTVPADIQEICDTIAQMRKAVADEIIERGKANRL